LEQSSIERIRTATFPVERRGYDKREVEHFLNRIADWLETGGGDQARADIVKRELERVGHHTAGLLASAQDSAERIRAEAEEEAAETRQAADEYAARIRVASDDAARRTRTEAEERARELIDDAEEQAQRIVEEGEARRREIETLISDLVARHDSVVAEANRLADELRDVSDHNASTARAEGLSRSNDLESPERVGT
jgi:DivIVA domain-containing protein